MTSFSALLMSPLISRMSASLLSPHFCGEVRHQTRARCLSERSARPWAISRITISESQPYIRLAAAGRLEQAKGKE
ncbi:uncharacterized [Tachysurus ichikawai]